MDRDVFRVSLALLDIVPVGRPLAGCIPGARRSYDSSAAAAAAAVPVLL